MRHLLLITLFILNLGTSYNLVDYEEKDKTSPIIVGPDILEWDCPYDMYLLDLMKKNYKVIDDLDGDVSYTLSIVDNTLGAFVPSIVGDFEITLRGVDSSGNECKRVIVLRIIDTTHPVVKLKDITVNLSSISDCSMAEFYKLVIEELSDNLGKINTFISAREIVGEKGFYGKYEVIIKVVDSAGNETLDVALLRIIDDMDEELYIDNNLINANVNEVYSIEDIKNKISDCLYKEGILYDSFNLISCDYLTNEKKAGSYTAKYRYIYNGQSYYVSALITVNEVKENYYYLLLVLIVPIFFYIYRVNKKKKRLKSIP